MQLKLYPKLSTRSKRAILRTTKRFGNPVTYNPRVCLLKRLSSETGLSEKEVRQQLIRERQWLLENRKYFL